MALFTFSHGGDQNQQEGYTGLTCTPLELTVWQGYVDAFLKPPPQCLVNIPGEVGGSQYDD